MCRYTVPSSVLLIAGLVLLAAGVLMLRQWLRLRQQLEETRRVLYRSRASIAETERVQVARDQVLGTKQEDTDLIRWGYDVIAGVPLALIEASPMPKDAVRIIRDAHGVVTNGVYNTVWGIDRAVGLGIIDSITGKRKREDEPPKP